MPETQEQTKFAFDEWVTSPPKEKKKKRVYEEYLGKKVNVIFQRQGDTYLVKGVLEGEQSKLVKLVDAYVYLCLPTTKEQGDFSIGELDEDTLYPRMKMFYASSLSLPKKPYLVIGTDEVA